MMDIRFTVKNGSKESCFLFVAQLNVWKEKHGSSCKVEEAHVCWGEIKESHANRLFYFVTMKTKKETSERKGVQNETTTGENICILCGSCCCSSPASRSQWSFTHSLTKLSYSFTSSLFSPNPTRKERFYSSSFSLPHTCCMISHWTPFCCILSQLLVKQYTICEVILLYLHVACATWCFCGQGICWPATNHLLNCF